MGKKWQPAVMESMGIIIFFHVSGKQRKRSEALPHGPWIAHYPATDEIFGSGFSEAYPGKPVLSVFHRA